MNFSVSKINKIMEKIEENIDIIQSKLTNSITNKRKQGIWASITAEVNAIGVAECSVQDIKDKWKNMSSLAKKEYSFNIKSSKATGGGPPPKQPSAATELIIKLFENTPSFTGLKGFESTGFGQVWACEIRSTQFVLTSLPNLTNPNLTYTCVRNY